MSMKALVERCLSEAISLSLNDDGGIDIHAESEISSATIELLKANKAELIAFLTSQQQKVVAKPLSAIAATGQPVGPLSFAQQRLWLIDQIDGESSQYNLATALQLKGMLNVDALEQAIAQICARHQILRTLYRVNEDETVQQVVSDDWAFKLTQIDLTELDQATRKEEIAALIEQDAQCSFDLSTELMLRATLVKEQEQQFVLLLTMHHIASDGWSRHILCDEMFSLYNDFSAGRAPALPELPIQYSDYARWQRTELSGETLEKLTGYWREKLAGHSGQHSLPLDKARPKVSSFKGQTIVRKLDVSTTAQWNRFAQQSGVTLFMLLHAGLVSLLSRYSNDTDIVIGTPTANRDNDQLAPLVGFFVNSLALRTELKQQCSFNELLQQCRDCLLDAFEHQQAPFEYLVEQMQVERHLNLSPIFQVMLALQNNAAGIPRLAGMEITPVEQQSQTAKFDLSLDVIETETGLELSWEYATDIFNHDTIASMAAHFEHLLQQCMAAPTQDIFTLAILTPPEQTAQLAQLLAPSMPDNLPCIHQLVEQQAVSEPHTKALVWQNRSLTYLELNQQANQLAHLLNKEHGVCQAHRVALMVERSIESIIGLLAILKLGSAYLPLDPATPAARLSHILQDSGVQLALTQQRFSQVIAQLKPDLARVELDLEATLQQCSEQPNANLPQTVSAQDVAYVIYTSGSTGLPKAVLQTHQTITNLVASTAKHDGLSTPLRTLQFTPLTFDVSIQELATTWYTASELVLITEAEKAQLDKLSERVEALQIQRLFVPPAVMQLVAEQALLQHKKLPELQQVIVAGEALYMSVELRQFFDGHPSCDLWNHYGPTETHVATTFNATHSAADSWPAIGVAIEGIDSLILGPNQQLLPAGCVGELYIGGVGLAQGYLNQDELTAEKFIPHPYRQQDDARLYKTGDLVKRSPDGQLLYIGRRDNQVKLRGFRIELGEIEAKLSSCDGVVAAAVLLKQDPQLQKQLVAYVKLLNQQVKLEQIKVQLSANLPDYMQPSQYIALDALPLNRNGKIDRHALPEPDWQAKSRDYQAPSSATELALSQIWQDVLGHRQIGCSDNFFQLGGHSLSATRVIARVNHQFGINLAVKQLFEHQTLAQLAQAISLANVSDTEKFTPVSRDEPILASFAQQRLWLLDNIQGGSAQYNMHETLQLDGHLDLDALNRAFSYILARHESLRTCFQTDEQGAVYQLIQPASAMTIAVTDLSSQPMAQQGVNSQQIIEQEASRLFDLSQDMMLRAQLIRLSAQKHQLLVTMHHIAADGWSISILMNELSQAYRDYVAGTEVALAPLAFQYADYAHWQRRLLSGERLEQDLNYWQAKLQNLPLVHSLPLDHARPDQQSYRGAQLEQNLNLRTSNAFKALCQNNDATLFMGLHGALASLISGYSNETDIVIGTPIANREQAEVAPMIGFFINNLVLRSDLTGKPTFAQLLRQSKATLLDAYDHQQTPFEQVIERLQPERSTSHAPLFQILLVLQNNETANVDLPGIRVNPVALNAQIAKYDLSINVKDTEQGLSFSWEYNTDIFKPSSITAMAEHLTQLMDAICSSPDSPIANLNWISKSQLHQQLVAWNDTQTHYPDNVCLQQVFEQKAVEFADQLAVADTTTQLTYAQLNAKANQLAHYLREQYQVAPEQLIGVSLARSVDTVVTLLAILKAGGAYLPLDPLYPPERLAFMLDDSQANLVITQQDIADKIVNLGRHVDTLVLEQANDAISSQKTSDLEMNDQHCRQLAYVIYTSGTTGKPKGTLLEHRGAVNLAFGQKSAFLVSAQSRVLQFASFSFDAATFEWLMALMHGASLHICSDDSRTNPALLQQMLVEQKITHATLPPSLLPHLDIEANYVLQSLIVAGEACDPLQAQRWSQRYRLINAYGPSETTVCASAQVIEPNTPLTIGRGIANTQLYVLGANLNLLPVGAVGELYIAGDGVGRGYLNRDDLTAQRFIEHTLIAGEPATRLYKTGDLVRWQSDGQLVFLGRADDQVKIRGYRIELAEVEQQILNADGVKQCVALVREDKPGQPYLAAYLVASKTLVETEQKVLIETVRAQLAAQLPDYMIPSVMMCLEQLPLNSNGKIDRKALPQPDLNQGQDYVAPNCELERQICEIWQQVLKQPQIGLQDNFFQLGGHSLTATQVIAKVNQAFDLQLPVKTLFQAQTVSALVETINSQTSQQSMAIIAYEKQGPIPLSFAQQRLWLLNQIEGSNAHYNMPTVIELKGKLDNVALTKAMTTLVERHQVLRTNYPQHEPVQVINEQVSVSINRVNLATLTASEQQADLESIMQNELENGFDLERDLMLRATLVTLASEHHVLLVTLHHIASDGWSVSLLMREFSLLYQAFAKGEGDPLAPLPVQYADYAIWQREWLQGDYLTKQLSYWQQQLADLPRVHSLPLDFTRPNLPSFRGGNVTQTISSKTADGLRGLCQHNEATLFMGLNAAFAAFLSRFSNEKDIVIGSAIANREQAEVAKLLGFFVNNLVLRSDLSCEPSFTELLGQSRQTCLDAFDHQQVPFEQIVEVIQPERSVSHTPLFQIMLVLQNNEQTNITLPDLTVTELAYPEHKAKYDLTLYVKETPQGLALNWEYSRDVFYCETIEKMAENFAILLDGLVSQPSVSVFNVPMLSASESQYLLTELNATKVILPDSPLPYLFAQQADTNATKTAVCFAQRTLSYQDLNEQANQLARHLRSLGVCRNSLVGLCVERSEQMMVALLAIFKAGGAYVALDPHYPQARLAYMLADSGAQVVITQSHLRDVLTVDGQTVVDLDTTDVSDYESHNVDEVAVSAEDLAYVIYTSGSTGQPKGVMIQHGALTNFMLSMQDKPGLSHDDTLLAVTSLSFDIHTLELYLPLISGATLVIASRDDASQPGALRQLLDSHQVSMMQATPATWNMLIDDGWYAQQPLKVLCGGEALSSKLKAALTQQIHIALWNMYGPTETCVWSSVQALSVDTPITLGRPIANTQFYVVDNQLQPVPMGVAGELLIGGAGLAKGYLNRDALTAEKFINFTVGSSPLGRVYRTGDLVRYQRGGELEYLGRLDHQVKIRGFRIELGEIEECLVKHPAVAQCVVMAQNDPDLIVAYVVSSDGVVDVAAFSHQLRSYLSEQLPDYMLPGSLMLLDAMPLTANGKVDRKGLPDPDLSQVQGEYVAPTTDTEQRLSEIWQQVLGLAQVGINDNFFQLGGHSLNATKAVTKINNEFNINLALRDFFNNETLAQLAVEVDRLDTLFSVQMDQDDNLLSDEVELTI